MLYLYLKMVATSSRVLGCWAALCLWACREMLYLALSMVSISSLGISLFNNYIIHKLCSQIYNINILIEWILLSRIFQTISPETTQSISLPNWPKIPLKQSMSGSMEKSSSAVLSIFKRPRLAWVTKIELLSVLNQVKM